MADNARPEDVGPQREVDALSGLPDDSRVHLEDIEWPELDWSDADEPPADPSPPAVLRLVVPGAEPGGSQTEPRPAERPRAGGPSTIAHTPAPTGPKFNGKDGGDWRPAVPFWLRMPDPEPAAEAPTDDHPTDWRPAVPFWLRMPEPTAQASPSPQPHQDAEESVAEPTPESDPSVGHEAIPDSAEVEPAEAESVAADETTWTEPPSEVPAPSTTMAAARPEPVDELPPEDDLIPLPGTTGEAVFFPPSTNRAFAIGSAASAGTPSPPTSPHSAARALADPSARKAPTPPGSVRPGAAVRPATRSADGPYSLPSAPYAQYDSPAPDWSRPADNADQAATAEPVGLDQRVPPSRHSPQPHPRNSQRRWLIRGAVIGSVVGGLIAALVIVLATQGRFNTINGTITGAPVGAPEEVVTGYLNALAHSDSQQALGFAKLRPADQRMLTDEVLAASNKSAPLHQITTHTTELTDYRAQVEAAYLLGEQKISQSFTVYAVGNEWKLYDVARKVDLTQLNTSDLPLTLNGIGVAADSIELFPGHYQVATSDERYLFSSDTFVVKSPTAAPELGTVQLELSSAGVADVVAAANSQLKRCLSSHELQPPGCGFGAVAPKGTTVEAGSMRWKATKGLNSLTMLHPTLALDDPRSASAEVRIQVTGTAKDTKGGDLGVVDTVTSVLATIGVNSIEVTLD